MPKGLIVPINIEALCVNKGKDTLKDYTTHPYQFDALPGVGQSMLSKNIMQAATTELETGIYLHWALPDALTHGIQDEEGTMDFPAVPNRWLVSRFVVVSTQNDIQTKHWVVESNSLSDQPGSSYSSTAIPYDLDKPGEFFKYLGRVEPLESWQEKSAGRHLEKLTAVGYGIPEFAASFQHSQGVFSFYDDLKNEAGGVLKPATLVYQISGWYSNPEQDPVQNHASVQELSDTLAEHKWCLPANTELADPVTFQSFYAGTITNIEWDAKKQYNEPLYSNDVQIALGNTFSEALSALLASKVDSQDKQQASETILNALQLGILDEYLNPTSLQNDDQFKIKLHNQCYNAVSGGILWQNLAEGKPIDAAELADLNALQTEIDQLNAEIQSRQQQIYLYWTKSVSKNHPLQADLRYYLRAATAELKVKLESRDKKMSKLAAWTSKLQQLAAPRYYLPTEPVVLFSGEKIQPTTRYGGDGNYLKDKLLLCRLEDQLISKVSAANFSCSANDVKLFEATKFPFAVLRNLLCETVLLSHALLVALGPKNNSTEGITYTGIVPSPLALNEWKHNPWLPLYFSYTVHFIPHQEVKKKNGNDYTENYNPEFLIEGLELDQNNLKLHPTQQTFINTFTYHNTFLLGNQADVHIKEHIEAYLKKHPDSPIESLLKILYQQVPPTLSQSLFGFNAALLGLTSTLQFQVAGQYDSPLLNGLTQAVRNSVEGENKCEISNTNSHGFFPLAAGIAELADLRLIDVFGRHLDLPLHNCNIASALQLNVDNHQSMYIAPRLVAPSRLQAQWVPVTDASATPVIGWLTANFLDRSIWFFSADGAPYGALDLQGGESIWIDVPGTKPGQSNVLPQPILAIKDYLALDSVGKAFLSKSEEAWTLSQPAAYRQFNSNAMFMGVPIAVATIEMSLELQGLPPISFSESAIEAEMADRYDVFDPQDRFKRSQGLGDVAIPLRLGNPDHAGDGLLAYFKGQDFTTCVYFDEPDQELSLTLAQAKPQRITLLFDPRNDVHLQTGVLPIKELRLLPEWYTQAMDNLQLAFHLSPVLSPIDALEFPLPDADHQSWQWVDKNKSTGQWNEATPVAEPSTQLLDDFNVLNEGWIRLQTKPKTQAQ